MATTTTPGTLTADQISETVLAILGEIAPEADLEALEPGVEFRDQLDLDSMDYLNFILALHDRLGVEVPELDYPKLSSLDACVAYLTGAMAAA